MVDKDDIVLNVNINYNNNQIKIGKVKDLPSIDVIKNKIMRYLEIPNTKDYLYLSYKDDKGSGQKIGDDENIFKYAKEKPKSHQTEYILELDLSISDEVDKFKKFFNANFDENKYNENKKELDRIIKENEIVKNNLKEMEKSKIEELENRIKKIKEKKKKKKKEIIIKENIEKNKIIELLKKELENKKLEYYINELSKRFKEQINKFFEDKIQTFEIEAKKLNDQIIRNKDNAIITFKEQILKSINDLKKEKKELEEKNINYKNTMQKIKKDSEKDKSLNNSSQKDSELDNSILKGKDSKNLKVANNNEQSFERKPQDSLKTKNINNFIYKDFDIIYNESLPKDEFFNFLNKFFFKSQNQNLTEDEQNTLENYHYELKNSKENALTKLKIFYEKKMLFILGNSQINMQYKTFLENKIKELENYLKRKSLDKKDILEQKSTIKQNNNNILVKEKNYTQFKDNNNFNPNNQKNVIYNSSLNNSNKNNYQNNNNQKLKKQNSLSNNHITQRYSSFESNIYNQNRLPSNIDYMNYNFNQNNYRYKTQYYYKK